jgi:hypothetical protein
MRRRKFLTLSVFALLLFTGDLHAQREDRKDELETALNTVLALLNSLFLPLEQLGRNIDRVRYRRALEALGNVIDSLASAKTRIADLLEERPLPTLEIEDRAKDIKVSIRRMAYDVEALAFGLRKQFKDEGNRAASQLRFAVNSKSWINRVNHVSSMTDEELDAAAGAARVSGLCLGLCRKDRGRPSQRLRAHERGM